MTTNDDNDEAYGCPTRREFLGIAGATALAAGLAGCSSGDSSLERGWNEIDSPTDEALYDAVTTTRGPHAVGESGRVLARRSTDWKVLVENGPAGAGNGLVSAAATDDGRALWCCGDSGAIGRYAVAAGRFEDYSAPGGKTSSWEAVAVAGRAGSEQVLVLNGSGELLRGQYTDGEVSWGDVRKPAGGLSVGDLVFAGGAGFIGDANGDVYRATDLDSWARIGIDGENATLHALAAPDAGTVTAVADDGAILLYDGHAWLRVADAENALHAVDRAGGRGLAAGVDGAIYSRMGTEWTARESPISKTLHGVALDDGTGPPVAVGADGTILERFGRAPAVGRTAKNAESPESENGTSGKR